MKKKEKCLRREILTGVLVAFTLVITSCAPQLSVQQYDQLKQEIAELDMQRQTLEQQMAAQRQEFAAQREELAEEFAGMKARRTEALAYVKFLEELKSTQSSEKLLSGQFDAKSLIDNKDKLTDRAKTLGEKGDNDIAYYLGLMKPNEDTQTMQAYYKIFEICVKKIKANLE